MYEARDTSKSEGDILKRPIDILELYYHDRNYGYPGMLSTARFILRLALNGDKRLNGIYNPATNMIMLKEINIK